LLVLVHARFDQRTRAENALANTQAVYDSHALSGDEVTVEQIPPLKAPRRVTPEDWRRRLWAALPGLKRLAKEIASQGQWTAGKLTNRISGARIPDLGTKTTRLAVRFIHELVPGVSVDMNDALVPVDTLVYRVACRLGVVDPESQRYTGAGSPGDGAIQVFARKVSPENPALIDEPLWATGRSCCRPTSPRCSEGCILDGFCPKLWRDADPASIGFGGGKPALHPGGEDEPRQTPRPGTPRAPIKRSEVAGKSDPELEQPERAQGIVATHEFTKTISRMRDALSTVERATAEAVRKDRFQRGTLARLRQWMGNLPAEEGAFVVRIVEMAAARRTGRTGGGPGINGIVLDMMGMASLESLVLNYVEQAPELFRGLEELVESVREKLRAHGGPKYLGSWP
jgi:hypothetical protein